MKTVRKLVFIGIFQHFNGLNFANFGELNMDFSINIHKKEIRRQFLDFKNFIRFMYKTNSGNNKGNNKKIIKM